MLVLKDRHKQIPNGLRFYQPETKWTSRPWSSFQQICQQVQSHRSANPARAKQHGWSLNLDVIAAEVDRFNALLCAQMGWTDFVVEGGDAAARPFRGAPSGPALPSLTVLQKGRALAAGAAVLVDWVSEGAPAVPAAQSARRAEICAGCQQNAQGDWTRFFTVPASRAIQAQVERRGQLNLSTPFDDKLQVCDVCLCPLKLKVHVSIGRIREKLPAEVRARLPDHCWIKQEP